MVLDPNKLHLQLLELNGTITPPASNPLLDILENIPFGGIIRYIRLEIRVVRMRREMVEQLKARGLDTSYFPKSFWP
jgi:hypothetical protein